MAIPVAPGGKAGNPSLRASFVMDATSRLFVVVEAVYGGYREASEQELGDWAIAMTAEPGVLLELDRGYYSVNHLRNIVSTEAHALCRVSGQVKLAVLKRLPDHSYLSLVRDNNASRTAPCGSYADDLLLRVIGYDVVEISGKRRSFRLVTTLTGWRLVPARQAAQGYHLRWREEVSIRELKWMKKNVVHPSFGGKTLHGSPFRSDCRDRAVPQRLPHLYHVLAVFHGTDGHVQVCTQSRRILSQVFRVLLHLRRVLKDAPPESETIGCRRADRSL